MYANNEIFNIPYTVELKNHNDEKKILTKVNFDFLKLQVKNDIKLQTNSKKWINRIYL